MKKLLLLVPLCFLLQPLVATAADSVTFNWKNAVPVVTDDSTVTCNNQSLVAYNWQNAFPTPVYNATATCTVVVNTVVGPSIILIKTPTTLKNGILFK